MKFERFTVEERREIVSIYSTMRGSARAVGVLFHMKYPHRPRPCTATVYTIIKKFRETGSVHRGPRRRGRSLITDSATASSLVTNVALHPQNQHAPWLGSRGFPQRLSRESCTAVTSTSTKCTLCQTCRRTQSLFKQPLLNGHGFHHRACLLVRGDDVLKEDGLPDEGVTAPLNELPEPEQVTVALSRWRAGGEVVRPALQSGHENTPAPVLLKPHKDTVEKECTWRDAMPSTQITRRIHLFLYYSPALNQGIL
ncbi:hypothetical protein AOXY_G34739 [Acipenser oxyrinchus oxyrinchus]|uniref:DUF4817 domain-containing protein n=1 Tax=Acipenser oxyrinchus oxyrinchus TaxID=40147 RepID=A0AAD8FR89_ACIOX|nr:hypothetical protein AOXY_G34739 [Acipenser oxyrinchus oxyrinchus]